MSSAPRRVFVQARQIYCYAKAAQMGWYPDGRAIALKGLEHLLSKAKAPDGKPGFVHTLKPDGTVLDPLRDSYDHAFVLLALAAVHALEPDAQVRAEIDALCHFVETQLRSPHGGVHEGLPVSLPRRQNPQMHLFEAMIAAFDATMSRCSRTGPETSSRCLWPTSTTSRRRGAGRVFRGRLVEDRAGQRRARASGGMGLAAEGI
jgi:mannose/cellobiose epimerase-like protein (N-acyl-D-glucosamine 2-epimerase family)